MNERIRELAEEARELATIRHPVSNIVLSVNTDLFEKNFAELIVRECANYAFSDEQDHRAMLKHFGVES